MIDFAEIYRGVYRVVMDKTGRFYSIQSYRGDVVFTSQ